MKDALRVHLRLSLAFFFSVLFALKIDFFSMKAKQNGVKADFFSSLRAGI